MTVHWVCPCGQRYRGRSNSQAVQARCPSCGQMMRRVQAAAPRVVTPSVDDRIETQCACGVKFLARRKLAGHVVQCPACHGDLVVPSPSAPISTTPTPSVPASSTPSRSSSSVRIADTWKGFDTLAAEDEFAIPADDFSAPVANPLALGGKKRRGTLYGKASGINNLGIILLAFGGGAVLMLFVMGLIMLERASSPSAVPDEQTVAMKPLPTGAGTPAPSASSSALPPAVPVAAGADANSTPGSGTTSDSGTLPLDASGGAGMAGRGSQLYSRPRDVHDVAPTAAAGAATKKSEATPKASLGSAVETWFAQPEHELPGASAKDPKQPVLVQYSWMTLLLPYLGFEELHNKFNYHKSWTDKNNLILATTVIPDFLDPRDSRERWDGAPFGKLGLTHFVGMAGIDQRNKAAGALPRSDPLAGVFGYHDVARAEDITDGTSNTIMIAEAGELVGPWIANGGATVRGAREPFFDPLSGFGSKSNPEGTVVLMADGSTRFLSRKIDPQVFRALCTIHGKETVATQQVGRIVDHVPTKRRP